MKKKCILPIEKNPSMKTYPYFAIYLGALEAIGYSTQGIKMNHFLTLQYSLRFNELNFKERRYFQSMMDIERFAPLKPNNALDYVRKKVSQGNYISIMLNGNPIAGYPSDGYHDWAIYGFDDFQNKLYLIGFTLHHGPDVYEAFQISYNAFINALPKAHDIRILKRNFMFNHCFKIKDHYEEEQPNFPLILKTLQVSTKGVFSVVRRNQVFLKLRFHIRFLQKFSLLQKKRMLLDRRSFSIIHDHAQILSLIAKQYSSQEWLCSALESLAQTAESMLVLSVQYALAGKKQKKDAIIQRVLGELRYFQKNESCLIRELVIELEKQAPLV